VLFARRALPPVGDATTIPLGLCARPRCGWRATLEGYVEAGLTPAQALQSATWEAGRRLGDDGLGVLRPQAWADLVAMQGDPTQGFSALRAPLAMIKAGRIVVGAAESRAG
jgi:hypothetical protein